MGMGTPPDIWTYDQFKSATNPEKPRKKLAPIDEALKQWAGAKNGRSKELRVKTLRTLASACIAYLKSQRKRKEDKEQSKLPFRGPSARLVNRINQTQNLLRQAMIRLAYEQFEYQKHVKSTTAGKHVAQATRQNLQPGYSHERYAFTQMKTAGGLAGVGSVNNPAGVIEPPSSSFLRDCQKAVKDGSLTLQGGNPVFNQHFINTPFASLTDQDLDALAQDIRSQGLTADQLADNHSIVDKPHVHFLRKDERINRNMLLPIGGKLYSYDGEPYTTSRTGSASGGQFDHRNYFVDLYAIDAYGNLFHYCLTGGIEAQAYSDTSQWNHSSLVAGREVICAGEIVVDHGDLLMINNNSGHYQPNSQKLSNAVAVLIEEYDLPLQNTIKQIYDGASRVTYTSVQALFSAVPPQ